MTQFSKTYPGFGGNMHYITVGLGAFGRKIHRAFCSPTGRVNVKFPFKSVTVPVFNFSTLRVTPGSDSPVFPSVIFPVRVPLVYFPY